MSNHLTIGQVARLSGLTIKALRHYDTVAVLRPVAVDEANGYRLYSRLQVEQARQIRVLRELEVPLDEIRQILRDPASEEAVERLTAHRRRVGARLSELQTVFYFLGKLIEGKEIQSAMPARPTTIAIEPELQKKIASDLFNYVWTLLEKEDRTDRESDLMLNAAH